MKKCKNCSSFVRDGDKYCRNCGLLITSNLYDIVFDIFNILIFIGIIFFIILLVVSYLV